MTDPKEEHAIVRAIAIGFAKHLRPYVVLGERCCLPTPDGEEPVWEDITDVYDQYLKAK